MNTNPYPFLDELGALKVMDAHGFTLEESSLAMTSASKGLYKL